MDVAGAARRGKETVSIMIAVPADVIGIGRTSRQARDETAGTLMVSLVVKLEVKYSFIRVGQFSTLIESLCSWDSSMHLEME